MDTFLDGLSALGEQIQIIWVLVQRPVVLRQVIAFILALVLATYGFRISQWLDRQLGGKISNFRLGSEQRRYISLGKHLIQQAISPIFGVIGLLIAQVIFRSVGWRTELLLVFTTFLWVLVIFRVIIAFFYTVVDQASMTRYYNRLFGPLFWTVTLLWLLNFAVDLDNIYDIVLFQMFEAPVTVGAVFIASVGFYFWINIAWAGHELIREGVISWTEINEGALDAALTIVHYIILGIGLAIVMNSVGFDPSTIAVITGGLSVGIGFALKDVISNFVSGLLLLFDQSLKPGDLITVEGEFGTVRNLSIRATTVRTLNGVDVVVPNQTFLTSNVVNYTKSDRMLRLLIPIGISYNSDPKQAMEIILSMAQRHGLVRTEPAPVAFFVGFGDSSLDFELGVWLVDAMTMKRVASDLRTMIWDAFKKNDIEIPFPQRDLHIRSGLEPFDGQSNGPLADYQAAPVAEDQRDPRYSLETDRADADSVLK